MPFMGAGTFVRPLALYPLVLLMPILLYQIWTKRITRPWNGTLTILLGFTLLALASTAIGSLYAPIELRGVGYWDRALRAWITLLIGLSFFVSAVWMNRNEDDLKFSLKWLFVGLFFHIAWSSVQAIGLRIDLRSELNEIQNLFSIRGLVRNRRVSGFAYEPSWLAGQLATLYIPWLFAALLARYHMSRFKWLEPLLLLGAFVTLLLTYSRSGLIILLGAGVITFLLAGSQTMKDIWSWYRAGFQQKEEKSQFGKIQTAGSRIGISLILLGGLIAAGYFLASKGYIAAFWNSSTENVFSYAVDVYLGPRLAYVVAALSAFHEHPLTGVGLGASGFYIYNNMPDWALNGIPEIARQLSPNSNLYPNPKNLFVRLLVETGLPGFILYVSFLFTTLAYALTGLRRSELMWRFVGTAGIYSVVAVGLQSIAQDSFAMPEMWINLGILAGMMTSALESRTSSGHDLGFDMPSASIRATQPSVQSAGEE
jgi:O-antigen ligase